MSSNEIKTWTPWTDWTPASLWTISLPRVGCATKVIRFWIQSWRRTLTPPQTSFFNTHKHILVCYKSGKKEMCPPNLTDRKRITHRVSLAVSSSLPSSLQAEWCICVLHRSLIQLCFNESKPLYLVKANLCSKIMFISLHLIYWCFKAPKNLSNICITFFSRR